MSVSDGARQPHPHFVVMNSSRSDRLVGLAGGADAASRRPG